MNNEQLKDELATVLKERNDAVTERDRLRAELAKICTEVDYLLAAIQDDKPGASADFKDSDTVFTPRLDKLWIEAFYQELPIGLYSRVGKD